MTAYYNENDKFAAVWLRELIKAGQIAPGEVDERSIEDVFPNDLRGFTQCHFFAGIGGWSYALRLAGWPDDRPVWTGSCPCQPYSAAGKRKGNADERNLWPAFFHLISQSAPRVVFGEQVASKDGLAWFDTVQADLESAAYACWAWDLCAAGVGAPHIRQRLYFVAESGSQRCERERLQLCERQSRSSLSEAGRSSEAGELDYASNARHNREGQCDGGSPLLAARSEQSSLVGELGEPSCTRLPQRIGDGSIQREALESPAGQAFVSPGYACELAAALGNQCRQERQESEGGGSRSSTQGLEQRSLYRSPWHDCDWIPCIDGKARPVEPGTFPLVNGAPNRVGRLRGYGNAIVAPLAQTFIEAYMEVA